MHPRSHVARRAVLVTGGLSRRLGLGAGSTIGGRVGLALDPDLLGTLAAGREIALVSGTNGKTTTTHLLWRALGGSAAVASSAAGSNMPAGLVAALARATHAPTAALEVDEGYLCEVSSSVQPRVIVVLNLSRDQLDRVGEVHKIAARWRSCLATTEATVVANCDDPLVTWASQVARHVVWVAAGGTWRADARHCPACDATIEFAVASDADYPGWHCACGFARPQPDARLDAAMLWFRDRSLPVELALPGRFNLANAAMAAVAAACLGRDPEAALATMSSVADVAGRFSRARAGTSTVRLLLAKNPAGWSELLDVVCDGTQPIVLAINARDADGHDPSWLWDVPFERLAGRSVVATGERCRDLAVRLRHAGVDHVSAPDQLVAVHTAGGTDIDYIGNYTAFQQLRRALGSSAPADTGRSADGRLDRARLAGPAGSAGLARAAEVTSRAGATHSRARGPREEISVVAVHPDLLGTYGDVGNAIVLVNRARWRGLPARLVLATSDGMLPRSGDIYCLGGGEDGPQTSSARLLADGSLARALDGGATALAVCAGFQILGNSFPGPAGQQVSGLGLLDVETVRGDGPRSVGEVVVEPSALPSLAGYPLSGFENHAGVTRLGAGIAPLGSVVVGTGNGVQAQSSATRIEGAVVGRVVATYLHGPVLARNPALADLLLEMATGEVLAPIDEAEEEALRSERIAAARNPPRTPRAAAGR